VFLSEKPFYSIQGEGVSSGIPSIFLRVFGCNLRCGGPEGQLVKDGKATWSCDTESIWNNKIEYSKEDILKEIENFGQLENVFNGSTHIIWTGGEACIPQIRKNIINFYSFLYKKYPSAIFTIFNELETNGTIVNDDRFYLFFQQINCSPKLSNSGIDRTIRIKPDAIKQILDHDNYWFKFVVSNENDIKEIQEDFVKPFDINSLRIILMPAVTEKDQISERTEFIIEMAKKYNYRMCTRMHILCWGNKKGV
jgi:7-carboxy-7-deazaguanine synthase